MAKGRIYRAGRVRARDASGARFGDGRDFAAQLLDEFAHFRPDAAQIDDNQRFGQCPGRDDDVVGLVEESDASASVRFAQNE